MLTAEAGLLAGAATVALGGLAGARARHPGRALALQAAGMSLLGAIAVIVAVRDATVGSGFHSALRPALGLDRLSAVLLAALALVALPALAAARDALAEAPARRPVTALGAGFLLAMVLVLVARDVTTFLAGWELMTLLPAAIILVTRGTEASVRRAVLVYLGVTHVGGTGTWAALLVLAGHGAIGEGGALGPGLTAFVAVAAIVGFGTKAGLMPLHPWLPRAHPVAPSHVSALMSGLMTKLALYGLVRVLFEWLGAVPLWVGLTVLALGLLSALGGVLYALVEDDLKRLLAFSSIENVGIVALGLGAALVLRARGAEVAAALALAAALLHAVNHAAFKALLFIAAGVVQRATGSLHLDRMGGLLRRMPWTGGALLVGCLAIAGVPPLNGFVSEWLTLQALIGVASGPGAGIAAAGGVAVAGLATTAALGGYCFVKVAGLVLLGTPRTPEAAAAADAPASTRAALAALAAACLALAAVPGLLLPVLAGVAGGAAPAPAGPGLTVPGSGGLPTPALLVTFAGLVVAVGAARGRRRAAAAPAWACGQPVTGLAWTSAGFTKPLRLVLEAVLRPQRSVTRAGRAGVLERVTYRAAVPHLFDTALYRPTARAALRGAAVARRLQSGSVRTYAAYLLAAFVSALVLAHWGLLG